MKLEVEQPGLEPAIIWNASIVGCSLSAICYSPSPYLTILNEYKNNIAALDDNKINNIIDILKCYGNRVVDNQLNCLDFFHVLHVLRILG